MSNKKEIAKANFDSGLNCAQTVLKTFEETGIAEETIRAFKYFGSGFTCGEICGALSGGLFTVGHLVFNKGVENKNADELLKLFNEEFGNVRCFDLLEYNTMTNEEFADKKLKGSFRPKCQEYIFFVVDYLGGLI